MRSRKSYFSGAFFVFKPLEIDVRGFLTKLTYKLQVLNMMLPKSAVGFAKSCYELKQLTGKTNKEIADYIGNATNRVISSSWISRHIKAYELICTYKELADIKDIERLYLLSRVPIEQRSDVFKTGVFRNDERLVDIRKTPRNKLSSEINGLLGYRSFSNPLAKVEKLSDQLQEAIRDLEGNHELRALYAELKIIERVLKSYMGGPGDQL